MLGDQATIISSGGSAGGGVGPSQVSSGKSPLKKILMIGGAVLLLLLVGAGIWLLASRSMSGKSDRTDKAAGETASTTAGVLPNLSLPQSATTTVATTTFSNVAVEYLSFADFYKKPESKIEVKLNDYELPLNVKIDVLNYYDISRKLALDPAISGLNENGFAIIDNPWAKESRDFYSIYGKLEEKQVPFLITSDFVLYYHQTILKKAFKNIESDIFFDSLWNINKELYTAAKNRYEARLADIGNVNDSILEGERLETAFFAVALELLKPAENQIAPKGTLDDENKFVTTETDKFYFVTPPYLRDDVLREVELIRAGKEKVKSPVMLYSRDYKDFTVPSDYRQNARLNNFYLTTKWLNSVFPLNYRGKSCPNCLLDKEDWRLGMIAASFISTDFSDSPGLKNEWARIYKVMSYFNPLREDLNYVYYRDALRSVFGDEYDIIKLFEDKNAEAKDNLSKLQAKLNSIEFSPFLGAFDKTDQNTNYRLGFKMLVETYLPNDYIFSHLTYPSVDTFQGKEITADNVTACLAKGANRRCNSIVLDTLNLVHPIANSDYFAANTSYLNYSREADSLKTKLQNDAVWHTTNYWSTLSSLAAYLNADRTVQPLFSRTLSWYDRTLTTAASAWIDMQLPLDEFTVNQLYTGQGFDNFSQYSDNSYVEPNLDLVDELIADNTMMQKMFSALQVDREVVSVQNSLQSEYNNLSALRSVIIKELTGQKLEAEDNEIISNFAKQLTIENSDAQKILTLKAPGSKNGLKEDISRLRLMVLVHREGDDKVFSVGPVWSYTESR